MMRYGVVLAVVCGWAATIVLPPMTMASGTPAQKCAAAKRKAAGKMAAGLLGCDSKGAGKSLAVPQDESDPLSCVGKVAAGLSKAFMKADAVAPGCEGAADVVTQSINSCADHVNTSANFDPTTGQVGGKCPAAKLKAAGKKASAKLGCYSKAAGTGDDCTSPTTVCGLCLAKAEANWTKAATKADTPPIGPCPPADNNSIEIIVDGDCVHNVVAALPPTPVVCGNNIIDPSIGETCDDGNTDDCSTVDCSGNVDHCPKNCIIAACSVDMSKSLSAHVTLTSSTPVASAVMFIDYPEGRVRNPIATAAGGDFSNSENDLDYGLFEQLIDNSGSGLPSPLFNLTFEGCIGVSLPVQADFTGTCTISEAFDSSFNAITPLPTCAVTVP